MTILEQLQAVQAGLAEWAAETGATISVATDRAEFAARITENPLGLPVVLWFTGEKLDEAGADAFLVRRTFSVVLARHHGWTATRADNSLGTTAGGPALLDLLEGLRNAVANVEFGEHEDLEPTYLGAALADTGDARLDAWELTFECGSLLGQAEE